MDRTKALGRVGRVRRDARGSRGMVTAEIAVGILAVLVAATLIAVVVASLSLRSQCQAAASEIARHAARGDDHAVTETLAELPDHLTVTRGEQDRLLVVTVRAPVRIGLVTLYEVSVTVETRAEPGP